MRVRVIGTICAACAASAGVLFAPGAGSASVNPVVQKMIAAYGGSAVLDSIKTRHVVVAASIQGEAATITSTYAVPNRLLQVVTIPALHVTVTTGYDGANGWVRDSYAHVVPLTADQLAAFQCLADDPILELLQSSDALSVQSSRSTVDGKQYDTLRVAQQGCSPLTLLVDENTHLISRVIDAEQTLDFSDYMAGAAGDMYPKTVVTTVAGFGTTVGTVTSEQVNAPVDDSIFTAPAPGSTAAPAANTPSASPAPTSAP